MCDIFKLLKLTCNSFLFNWFYYTYFILNLVIFIVHHFYSQVTVCKFNVCDWPFNLFTVSMALTYGKCQFQLWTSQRQFMESCDWTFFALIYLQKLSIISWSCSCKGWEMVPGGDNKIQQCWVLFWSFLFIFCCVDILCAFHKQYEVNLCDCM